MPHLGACHRVLAPLLVAAGLAAAQTSTLSAPGQPLRTDAPIGQFEIVGNSLASAQQMFLGTLDKVYIVDKVENNPTQINGHPTWGSEYSISSENARAMDVITNSFCAGGGVLGNGTWLNAGGNQAVTYGGLTAQSQTGGAPYDDPDGGQSLRLLDPCDNESCNWRLTGNMPTRRWYPTLETLEDGRLFIFGGCNWGGFVSDASQTNPTYEFFPPNEDPTPITSPLLQRTLPANLYPITYLLPSGLIFAQANWGTALLDYKNQTEYQLPDVPDAVRTYPASAGTAMLPLTPANNWTATILLCGGSNISNWATNWDIAQHPASQSCVTITPDVSQTYEEDDPLPEGRSMGNLVLLPTGKIFCLNGAGTGVAGYGNDSWAIGESYADDPILSPLMYDPSAPAGQRWSRNGLSPSTIPRMYHSTAMLLPDGAVLVAGSNPNSDYNTAVKYPTEYRVEKFYPYYYNSPRPAPQGIPSSLSYGGAYFNVTLSASDLADNVQNVQNATVVVTKTGFSTHAMQMGHRMLVLESSYTGNADGTATLHVSQVPPNPALLQPGPALLFVVVAGVPSVGVQVMVGSGQIGAQGVQGVQALPAPYVAAAAGGSKTAQTSGNGTDGASGHGAGTTTNQVASGSAALTMAMSGLWLDVVLPGTLAGLFLLASLA